MDGPLTISSALIITKQIGVTESASASRSDFAVRWEKGRPGQSMRAAATGTRKCRQGISLPCRSPPIVSSKAAGTHIARTPDAGISLWNKVDCEPGLYTRSRCALCLNQAYYHNSFGNEGDRYVLLQTSESGFYWSHPALTRGWFLAFQGVDTNIVNWTLATTEAQFIASPPPPMLPLADHGVWQDTTSGLGEWPHPHSYYATPDHPIDGYLGPWQPGGPTPRLRVDHGAPEPIRCGRWAFQWGNESPVAQNQFATADGAPDVYTIADLPEIMHVKPSRCAARARFPGRTWPAARSSTTSIPRRL